jgi:hypothetical protein
VRTVFGEVAGELGEGEEVIGHWNFDELNVLDESLVIDQLSTLDNIPRLTAFSKDASKIELLEYD